MHRPQVCSLPWLLPRSEGRERLKIPVEKYLHLVIHGKCKAIAVRIEKLYYKELTKDFICIQEITPFK